MLEAPGSKELAGFDAGGRFLDLRDGLAPDKLTAEVRRIAPWPAKSGGVPAASIACEPDSMGLGSRFGRTTRSSPGKMATRCTGRCDGPRLIKRFGPFPPAHAVSMSGTVLSRWLWMTSGWHICVPIFAPPPLSSSLTFGRKMERSDAMLNEFHQTNSKGLTFSRFPIKPK